MITLTIRPYLRVKNPKKNGECPLWLTLRSPGEKAATIPLKSLSLPASHWNQKKCEVTKAYGGKSKNQWNLEILEERLKLVEFAKELEQGKYQWPPQYVKEQYLAGDSKLERDANPFNLDVFIDEILNRSDSDAVSFRSSYKNVQKLIKKFDPNLININQLTLSWIQDFDRCRKRLNFS